MADGQRGKGMNLSRHAQDWEDLGHLDPCWAILISDKGKFGGWGIDQFFHSGEETIASLMKEAEEFGFPVERERALDFGCGVGRLTRALANYFERCWGLDISRSMLAKARDLNAHIKNCEFVLNQADHLRIFPAGFFDLVYSALVLQHLPNKTLVFGYISEFSRVLKQNGLLVFQLPCYIPLRHRLQPRRRIYSALRTLGFNSKFLYERLNLYPIIMTALPEREVLSSLKEISATVLDVRADSCCGEFIQSRTYYLTKK